MMRSQQTSTWKRALTRTQQCWHPNVRFLASRTVRNKISVVYKAHHLWHFVSAAWTVWDSSWRYTSNGRGGLGPLCWESVLGSLLYSKELIGPDLLLLVPQSLYYPCVISSIYLKLPNQTTSIHGSWNRVLVCSFFFLSQHRFQWLLECENMDFLPEKQGPPCYQR